MEHSSKALLELEHSIQSSSTTESPLLVCKNNNLRELQRSKPKPPDGKSFASHVGKSQVLGKVKDFLGVISEANKRLVDDAMDNAKYYDIEVLTGNESEYIEMDLMLGVADLHTPEAVAAAESAISGCQPLISLAANCSGSESEDSSHDGSDSESDDDYHNGRITGSPPNLKRPKPSEDGSPSARECRSKKQPKIVELS